MKALEIVDRLAVPEGRVDPYPLYEQARRLGPVAEVGEGWLLVTGHEAANRLLRNADFGMNDRERHLARFGELPASAAANLVMRSLLQTNPPLHAQQRAPIASVFTPRRVAALEPAVAELVERLLDRLEALGAAGGEVDFMQEFAFQLPVSVICELMGIPEQDRGDFRRLMNDLALVLEFTTPDTDLSAADAAAGRLTEYFTELLATRRAEPADDLVSALAQLSPEDTPELLGNLTVLLLAGFETTTNLLGNGLQLLFEHPRVRAALAEGSLPAADLVEEVLRFDSPVQLTSRVALRPGAELEGFTVPLHGEVLVLLGAANRDPARFHRAEVFDPWRADNGPLSFGAGAHYCLGAMLARLEARTAFPALLRRFPGIRPSEAQQPVRQDRLVLRGYARLPVELG